MSKHRFTRIAVPATIGLAALASVTAIPVLSAGAATSAINVNAKCSGTSVANLQVQREDTGKLSVDFGVDMARHTARVPWTVSASDNGTTFLNGTVKTIGDGSFSVTRLLAPKPGVNTIVASATNTVTHEKCSIKGSL